MRMRAFYRDAVFAIGLYSILAGTIVFFLYGEVLNLFRIDADVATLAPMIQLAALFMFAFGIGYLIASRDVARHHLVLFVGILQNAGLAGLTAWYWVYEPYLLPKVCLLPAGLGALFAVVFLFAWLGALVESRQQRRRAQRIRISPPKPTPAALAAQSISAQRETPARSVAVETAEEQPPSYELSQEGEEQAEDLPEVPPETQPSESEPPASSTKPDEPAGEPELGPLARRDRSGITPDEAPDATR